MNLTDEQERLWSRFKDGGPVSIDDLLEVYPSMNRHSMNLRIKYLASKVAHDGWVINRTSALGRGSRGTFQAEKKF